MSPEFFFKSEATLLQLFGIVVQLLGLETICKTRGSASVVTRVTGVTPIF